MIKLTSRFLLIAIYFLSIQTLAWAKDENSVCLSEETIANSANDSFSAISFNPDNNQLAASTNNGLYLYNAENLNIEEILQPTDENHFGGSLVSWSPDSKKIAAYIDADKGIRVWNISTKQVINQLVSKNDSPLTAPTSMAWSPSGKYIALVGIEAPLQIWDVDQSKLIFEFDAQPKKRAYTDLPNLLAWSPNEDSLAFVNGSDISIWNVKNDKVGKAHTVSSGFSEAIGIDWSKQQQLAILEGGGYSIKVFDTQNWETKFLVLSELTLPYNPIALNWQNNDSILAVGTYTGQILLVDTKKDKIMKESSSYVAVKGFSNSLIQLDSSEDGKTIFSLNRDFMVFKWNMDLGCVIAIALPPLK